MRRKSTYVFAIQATIFGLAQLSCISNKTVNTEKMNPDNFIRIPPELETTLSASNKQIFKYASEDFNRILSGQSPKYAKIRGKITDGGSLIYASENYQLRSWSQLNSINGIMFIRRGVTLTFTEPNTISTFPNEHLSYTWLEASKNQPPPEQP